ncbi:MAG TPA: YeeE/YedE thiosulfate transporter family protein [Victivallales bacterium]|nr:YeeE/YedE thiosulfate transporter family protein [Victivallales bacterium]HPO89551.1 YeeE/YedE thiosulfate transporter family protein [Victivallales bacterium]HRU01317.1 YeeE/YedE thiosulfate transporter family protein [Victivallales bacterium]
MLSFFKGKWSAFISGFTAAFLFIFSLYVLNTPVGMSDAYLKISEYCRESIHMRKVSEYFPFDWQTAFLIGIAIGGFIASLSSGTFQLRIIPEDVKGSGPVGAFGITVIQNLIGGFLVMTGLQFAGDSFLGQWASAIQLSTGAWIFLLSFIIWGVVFSGFARAAVAGNFSEKKKKRN